MRLARFRSRPFHLLTASLFCVLTVVVAPTAALAASDDPPRAEHVIVVGAAGLRWQDVSATDTPTLARLAETGSVGTLSARTVPAVACPGEGWLTLGAGSFAAVRSPKDIRDADGCAKREPSSVEHGKEPADPSKHAGPPGRISDAERLRVLNHALRFDAHIGLLGDSVDCVSAVGRGAALAGADSDGQVDHYLDRLPDDPSALLRRCPVSLVSDPPLSDTSASERRADLKQLDSDLAGIDRHRPANTVVIIAGVSQSQSTQARLQVAIAQGPGFTGGWLHSPSTRRLPYVQLVDIAPTVMGLLGVTPAQDPAGRIWRGNVGGRPASLHATKARLVDAEHHALAQQDAQVWYLVGFGVLCGVVAVLIGWLLFQRRRGKHGRSRDRVLRLAAVAAVGLATVPVASSLANLVPWWRARWPLLAATAVVLAIVSAVVGALWLVRSRVSERHRIPVTVLGVAGLTAAVFIVDALTGCWLQLDSLLGYNPLLAGRFAGFGNPGFAVFGTAAVLLAGFAAQGHRRWVSLLITFAIAAPVVAVEGFPQWGADVGGILTLVPAFVVLGLLAARTAVTWSRLALAGVVAVGLVLLVGWLDYLRPEDTQTHFGHFFGGLLDGSAWSAIRRKLLANAEVLLLGPHTVLALVLVILLIVAIFRPPPVLATAYEASPPLRPALVAIAVLSIAGFATNDSGIIVPSVVMTVAGPLALAICYWAARGKAYPAESVSEPEPIPDDFV
jgi:hypothetical protein